MNARTVRAAGLTSLLVTFAGGMGCASTDAQKRSDDAAAPAAQDTPSPEAKPRVMAGPVAFLDGDRTAYIDAKTGRQMPFAQVVERLAPMDAVLVAEQHDQLAHHQIQNRIIEALAGRYAEDQQTLAVGMEMVDWDHQDALDRFVAGEIDVDGLFVALEWEKTWGHNAELYRDIFATAGDAKIPLVGLNAPRSLVRALAKNGVEGLTPEDKARLPEMNMNDKAHRAEIEAVFKHHHPPTKNADMFERFYAAQVLWDESMAQYAIGALEHGVNHIVVLAGTGHIGGYLGIPNRMKRRNKDLKLMTVVPVSLDDGDVAQSVAQTGIDEGWGDIIVIVKPRTVISI